MIGINARYRLRERPTGVQRAAEQLVCALIADNPARYRLFSPPAGTGRAGAQLWEQCVLPLVARRAGCRVVLNPIQTAPVFHAGVKQIVIVHDLNCVHHPEWFGRGFVAWNRAVTRLALGRADHVVAISDHVLNDLHATCGISADRSTRVYNIGPRWIGGAQPSDPAAILCVNPFQPHKNLVRVLAAFQQLRRAFPALELRLAGRPQENFAAIPGLPPLLEAPGVRVLGYLSDDALLTEYRRCAVMCYASLAEGFGLPVLEAAAAGALVVTSSTSSLPEVAGEGAFLVEPESIESIAHGLRCALRLAGEEREGRIEAGRRNLDRFSADIAVSAYARLFSAIINGQPEVDLPSTRAALTRRRA